jgi:hypothetical protein
MLKRMWKESQWPKIKYHPGICLGSYENTQDLLETKED